MDTQILEGRHPSTIQIARHFTFDHLPENELRDASKRVHDFAVDVIKHTPDGPELSAALRKILEAKDCLVRAVIGEAAPDKTTDTTSDKSNPDAVENKVRSAS